MGKEARIYKDRICKHCKTTHQTNAKGLMEHALYIQRLFKIGLVSPESLIVEPGNRVITE